jgi:outer membrane receptor protein involved in Fe transport
MYAINRLTDIHLLKGHIVDAYTKNPLAGANIVVYNTGTASDEKGDFILKLKSGKYKIKISYIGYHEKEIDVLLEPGYKHSPLYIELFPAILKGDSISVKAQREHRDIASYEINSQGIRNMPSPLPDALLSLRTLPGVTALNDQSSFYNVRGGNFDENLLYINGIEIYQPHIVRKGIAENPSLINSTLIKNINLRTGAFPVSYGDKLSSVLDITYKDQPQRSFSGSIEMSTVYFNTALMTQLSKKSSILLGLRKVNYAYLYHSLQTRGNYTPDYLDFQGLMKYKLRDNLNFELLGIQASSKFQVEPLDWNYNEYYIGSEYIYKFRSLYSGKEKYEYRTKLIAATINWTLNNNIELQCNNSIFIQNESENTELEEILYYLKQGVGGQYHEPNSNNYDEKAMRSRDVNAWYNNHFLTSKLLLTWHGSSFFAVNMGLELKRFKIKDSLFEYHNETTDSGKIYIDPIANYSISSSRGGHLIGSYLQSNIYMNDNLSLVTGIRWAASSLNNEQLFLPRVKLIWSPANIYKFVFAAGKYAQPPIYKEFQFREGNDENLLAQKATQYTIGLEKEFTNDLSLKIEAYYKRLYDIISYDLYDVKIRYSGYNDAKGYAYGLDAFIYGQIIPGTENWISYSYLKAREDLLFDTESYVPRPSDRRHFAAFYMEDYMKKYKNSRFFVRLVYGSGHAFTWKKYIFNHETNEFELSSGRRNNGRLHHYIRFDIGFSQTFKIYKTLNFTLREEILNLFDHVNELSYDLAFNRPVKQYLSGRIFNVGLRLEF